VTYEAEEKSWGPNYLRFGLALYDDFHGSGLYSLGVGVTVTPLNANGAEWRTDVGIGTPLRLGTELWYPLDDGLRWFVAPQAAYARQQFDFSEDPDIAAEVSTEQWQVGADLGYVFGTWGELRVGVRRGQDRESIEGGQDTDALDVANGVARFAWDTLDAVDFPREGVVGELEGSAAGEFLGGDGDFQLVRLRGSAFTSSGANTFGLGVDAGTSFDDELPITRQFRLGGFTRLSGTDLNSQAGDSLGLVRLMAWRALSPERPLFGVPLYAGMTAEAGAVWSEGDARTWSDVDPAGSIFLGADTPLGPAVIGFGMSDDGRSSLFLVFGRVY
jgi:NTE family protein